MQKINFIKMHGLGNDFVIIDNRLANINITKDLINKLSDRKSGAGCDQLITINSSNKNNIEAMIKIYNPSGDSAEACGNGTRCVAKLLFAENKKKEIKILSDAGILKASNNVDGTISINLGKLSTNWEKIPLSRKIDTLDIPIKIKNFSSGVAVNIGNPHIIFFGSLVDNVSAEAGFLFISISVTVIVADSVEPQAPPPLSKEIDASWYVIIRSTVLPA